MEEDAGVKAPVTRLRRRISIEQSEESKSPALNTPTKKRGGRKAAKSDLELIDENTPDNTTTKKNTKKAPIKDIIDNEEKPITPSRRSTRIKSNTSIVSETALPVDSPRAKRAARRLSQVGSDSEAPPTPIRQTRRTRKDSASSIEKVEVPTSTKSAIQITDVIIEEPESNTRKSTSEVNKTNTSPSNIRKSPRLQGKTNKHNPDNEKESIIQVKPNDQFEEIKNTTQETKDEHSIEKQVAQNNRLSTTSSDLIKNLKTEAKTETTKLNKSTSTLEIQLKGKPKRKRTKSWTTLTVSNENNFYSDNEETKKRITDGTKIPSVQIDKLILGDNLNTSLDQDKGNKLISKKKKKNSNSFVVEDVEKSVTNINKKNDENDKNVSINQNSSENNNINETSKLFEKEPSADIHTIVYIEDDSDTNSGKVNIQNRYEHEDQCVPVVQHDNQLENENSRFSLSSDKVTNTINKSKDAIVMNNSCEPMDVDETIPESLLITEIKASEINSSSSLLQLDKSDSKDKQNKSKRKSSILQSLNKSGNENKSTLILSQLKDTSTDINNVTKSPQIKSNILSKTADDLNTTQENDVNKRNLSLNYVTTSTPLQQKNLQKLGNLGNINTSIIDTKDIVKSNLNHSKNEKKESDNVENESPKYKFDLNNSECVNDNTDNKIDKNSSKKSIQNLTDTTEDSDSEKESLNNASTYKKTKISSLNKTSNQSITSNEVDLENESAFDEDSHKTSNLLDDEAEDGDDYESGDSLDENERQYLKENEIMEKGDTLTSDNDFSNDSDYEKDSFVVSSDEEDNELLEGTEDDLSMSDNELKMTAKSKKKFNERKIKEQKKASREMFESRHKLNKSTGSDEQKSKKHKQQLSSSESEDETAIKTKKYNRMRLDSSHEVSLLEDKNEKEVSKKKKKRLSESICDDNVINEKEITVCNESLKETDPLSINVKEKQKTPGKGNASISFINTDNDPNIESELTKTQTEIQDPLEDSMSEDDSLSSDNENIMQNYGSVLEGLNLNNTNKTKSKACDISLNIDKKQKKKKNTAIVDELNLTQVKSTKKIKNKDKQKQRDSNNILEDKITKQDIDDGASSDSIDLHLLFSEDSNSSDNLQNKKKCVSSNEEQFIPLKKAEGKTDIRENMDTSMNQSETSINLSHIKKNKKHKSESTFVAEDADENSVSFFIDTEGTLNKSLNKSTSKTNRKIMDLEKDDIAVTDFDETTTKKDKSLCNDKAENSDSDAPVDIPFKKEKRSSKVQDNAENLPDMCNKSITKTPNSEKKKKKKARESQILGQEENENSEKEESLNRSLSTTKNRKKSVSEINVELSEKEQANDKSLIKTPDSHKKKKRTSQSKQQNDEDNITPEMSISEATNSSKKKKQLLHSLEDNQIETKDDSFNLSIFKTPSSQKKKKKILDTQEKEEPETTYEKDHNENLDSAKKSKKRNSSSFTVENTSLSTSAEPSESAKKRKRKSSLNHPAEVTVPEGEVSSSKKLDESLIGSQKKKRKISQNEDIISSSQATMEENHLTSLNVGKENQLKNKIQNVKNNTEVTKKTTNNKRKQREDDEGQRISKVVKQNSFDKVYIPRLPASILKQLDDKPQQIHSTKKQKLISTTQFSVMEAKKRKNKPSNYLEESVYLNDDESMDKKQKKRLHKPKVLPFVPTALTSASGYTTNFKVNVIPKETKFVAQSNTVSNFKDEYLFNKKIKRQGTYELYKRNRNIKISKF